MTDLILSLPDLRNNAVNIKVTLTPNGEIHQIFHTTDIEKLLGIENLEDFINNTSF